jgi:hypothetical protein
VTFKPSAAKSYNSQVVIMSPGGKTMVPLSGDGKQGGSQSGPPKIADLHISATTLQFGSQPVGAQAQQSVTVTSDGTAPVTISAVTIAGTAFSTQAPALPATLQPGASMNLPVKFAPIVAGTVSGQLVLASNAANSPAATVSLSGDGVAASPAPTPKPPPPTPNPPPPTPNPPPPTPNPPPPTPDPPTPTPTPDPGTAALTLSTAAVDFGSVPVGAQTGSTVTLTSSGTAAVVLQGVVASGDGFHAGHLQLPLTLAPGQQISLPVAFAPSSTGSSQGQVTLADNATGSPSQIALSGTGASAASPSLSVSPTSVAFGDVTVGSDAFKTITLVSNGTVPVTINSVVVAGASFSGPTLGLPKVLQPSQQMSLKVQFDPTKEGAATGKVTVSSTSTTNSKAIIALNGKGVVPTTPSLAGSASSLSFGRVTVGAQVMKSVTVTSTGTAPATITAASLTGNGYAATYAGVPVQQVSAPITLPPGQQVTYQVAFDPTQAGPASGQLSLSTDTGSPVNVSLVGTGTAETSPALTVSATSLDYGHVQVNTQAGLQLTLTSSGTAPVTISSSTVAGQDFQVLSVAYPAGINAWPATLRPGQQIVLSIGFTPTDVGSATGNLTVNSDASGGTANIPLSGSGDAAPAPKLKLSSTSLSFGSNPIGSKASRTLTLTSTGDAPLTINSIALTGTQFSDGTVRLPLTLQPHQQLVLKVIFQPTTAGSDAETLTVTSDDASGPATVSLGGTGTTTTTPQLTVTPGTLDFGNVGLNAATTQPVTLSSTGTAPVTVTAAAVTGAGFSVSGVSFPLTLNPNQSTTLQVQFDPTTAGAATGQLSVRSDSSTGGTAHVVLTGTGTVATSPQLTLSATTLSFGNDPVKHSATLPLTLTSTGTAPMTVSAATLSGTGFSQSGASFPVTLNPNQSVTLQVQFDPTTAGPASGQITINSNSTSAPTVQVRLSGTGTVAATPQLTVSAVTLPFGNVTVNSPATLPLTLTSTGTAPVTISAATLSGADFSDSGASFPVTLNPNQSVTLQVQFDPATVGASSGQISIHSNSSSAPTVQVQLSGNGTVAATPQLAVSAATLSFGNVAVSSPATLPLTLTSTGTAPVTISAATLSGADFSDSGASFPVTLNPGQSITLHVQFDPSAAGAASGQITINSDSSGGGTAHVQLTGTGTVATIPQLTLSSTTLSFGNVTVNTPATLPLTLTSTGTASVTISAATLSGAGFSDSGAAFPLTLNPGQSITLQVQFAPSTAGAASGQVTINSNSSTGAQAHVQLTGTGAAATSPQLTLSTTALSFGNNPVNHAATLPLTLTSTGTASVTVSAATLSGVGFSDSGASFPLTLSPKQSVTLQVQFDPTTAGAASGQITINSNSSTGAQARVQLSGTGTAATSPQLTVSSTALSFGGVTVDTTVSLPLTLTSSGTAPVTVNAATLSGAGFSDSGGSFPLTLSPKQSVTLQVQFDPKTAGAASGQITINSNSATSATVQVQLSGTGTAAVTQHEIDLNWNPPTSSSDPVVGYNVYRSTNGGASFTKVNSSPETQPAYADLAVQSGTTYAYTVKSVDANGVESSASNQISLVVP